MKVAPIKIDFPLRGEWHTPTTPTKKIPSHGTHRMGLTYACDFVQINFQDKKKTFHSISNFDYIFSGVPLKNFYGYGQPIYAPCDGKIVTVVDGVLERQTAHWLNDLLIGLKKSSSFNEYQDDFEEIAGNYVIMQISDSIYALFAHLKLGSINVTVGDTLKEGEPFATVGHSGNSTAPHLHFQLMDRKDIAQANGLPFCFHQYERYENNQWVTVTDQLPSVKDRFRSCN